MAGNSAPMTCMTGDGRPAFWRGFCATCKQEMGGIWRAKVATGIREQKRRAIVMLVNRRRSVRDFGGGQKR